MPISKIKTTGVELDNLEIGGTEAARMPGGTAAQRGSSFKSGDIRFNTDINLMEYYDGTAWRSIDAPPVISSIASSVIPDSNSSFDLVITGQLFASGSQVKLIGTDNSEVSATVSVDSTSQITATIDGTALNNAAEDYDVKVTNPSGLSSILENSVSVNASPVWSTAAGSIGTFNHVAREGISITVTATDPEGGSVTYSVTSGSLPSGLSLNGTTGVISGDAASVNSDTTTSFTITASDGVNSSSRNFSITNKALQVYVYSYTGSDQSFTVPSNVSKIKTYIWGAGGTHSNTQSASNSGGAGGYSESIIGVTAAENFVVVVGQGGISYANGLGNGYGGGGTGAATQGGGGGGLSGIFTGTSQVFSGYTPQSGAHARSLIIAGGGGGAGIDNSDNLQTPNGGGINGLSAGVTGGAQALAQGGGGTQTAGGALGQTDTGDSGGTAGSALQGGYAVSGSGASGGGGGYYGGGSGRHDAGEATGHGGGGSGFIGFQNGSTSSVLSPTSGNNYIDTTTRTNGSRTYTNSKTLVATANTTNSTSAVSPPETSNTYYTGFQNGTYSPQGSGATGYYAGQGQHSSTNGHNGLVVIEM